jgi:hypothetical protein
MTTVMARINIAFERALEAQDDVAALARVRLHPLAFFARRLFRVEVHIHRRFGIDDEIFLLSFYGCVLCLRNLGKRSVMGFGTAHHAALVVGAQNRTDPNVMTPHQVGGNPAAAAPVFTAQGFRRGMSRTAKGTHAHGSKKHHRTKNDRFCRQ